MSQPRIHCLLSPKENFSESGAGAQTLKIVQTSRRSRYRQNITVFGKPSASPFPDVAFQPLTSFWPALFGDNMGFARAYARAVGLKPPDMIECFNRPPVAVWLANRFPNVPVTLYIGNDPQTKGNAKTVAQRRALIDRLAGIYFVSEYVYSRFMEGIGDAAPNVRVLRTGMDRAEGPAPEKDKTIVFVGRIEPIKGALELAEALGRVLGRHPDWNAYLIGARWFKVSSDLTPYERRVKAAADSSPNIHVTGFLPNAQVRAHLRRAAISVVPSNWEEPFARTAVEGLAEGCAVVASKRGGLVELGHRVRFLPAVTADEIERALEDLVSNDAERTRLQAVAWNDFPYTMDAFAQQWDDYRAEVMGLRTG